MKLGRNVAWMLGLGIVLVGVSAEAAKAPKAAAKATGGFATELGVVVPGAKSVASSDANFLKFTTAFAATGMQCKPAGEGSATQLLMIPIGSKNGNQRKVNFTLQNALTGGTDPSKAEGAEWKVTNVTVPMGSAWNVTRTEHDWAGSAITTETVSAHVWALAGKGQLAVFICDPAMAAAPAAAAPAPAPAPAAAPVIAAPAKPAKPAKPAAK